MKSLTVLYDKLLLQPDDEKKYGALYLPDSSSNTEPIGRGVVIKTGKGYPMVNTDADTAVWSKEDKESGMMRRGFLPLTVRPGDCVMYFKRYAIEISFDLKRFIVIPENAVVAIESGIDREIEALISGGEL